MFLMIWWTKRLTSGHWNISVRLNQRATSLLVNQLQNFLTACRSAGTCTTITSLYVLCMFFVSLVDVTEYWPVWLFLYSDDTSVKIIEISKMEFKELFWSKGNSEFITSESESQWVHGDISVEKQRTRQRMVQLMVDNRQQCGEPWRGLLTVQRQHAHHVLRHVLCHVQCHMHYYHEHYHVHCHIHYYDVHYHVSCHIDYQRINLVMKSKDG